MVGGVLSLTVIVWTQVDVLPHPSLAVHMRRMVVLQGSVPVTISAKLTVGVEQLSVAVAVPVTEGVVAPH